MSNDEIYYNSFPFLLHKITSNLRYIFLEIEDKKINVTGYYTANPDDIEIELLEDVSDGIAGMVKNSCLVTASYITSQQEYKLGMHSGYLLYARYEDF
jgi:hypothetical protein